MTAAMCILALGPGRAPAAGLDLNQGSPLATVDQATHDFGEVYEGEHISHTFTIRNTGTAPLEIRDPAVKAQDENGNREAVVAAALRREGSYRAGSWRSAAIPPTSDVIEAGVRRAGPLAAAGGRPAPS
jgi:hypothetical protein